MVQPQGPHRKAPVERDAILVGEHGVAQDEARYAPVAIRAAGAPHAVSADPSRVLLTVDLADGGHVELGARPRDLVEGGQQIQRAGELTVSVHRDSHR